MKKTSILFLLSFLFSLNASLACTCFHEFSFCGEIDSTTSVLEVEVIARYPGTGSDEYLDVKIIETLQNEISEDTITIAALLVFSCEEPLPMNTVVGDTLIINFPNLEFPFEDANHPAFNLYSCHTNILFLENDEVTGNIQPNLNFMNFDIFQMNLGTCNDFVNNTDDVHFLENNIQISPNPFSENLKITIVDVLPSDISVDIFSPTGQIIFSKNDIRDTVFDLPMRDFPKGIYFIQIRNENAWMVKKVLKT